MAKSFSQMNKTELIAAATSLGLIDEVTKSAKDPENITNAEYVTVLEAYKAKQDEVNADAKKDIDAAEANATVESKDAKPKGKVLTSHDRAKLKQVKYKYIVTDHQGGIQIDDDDIGRVLPISYGNLTSGPKVWNVGLHGNEQALPFSVVKKLEEIKMTVHVKDANGEPAVRLQQRFRVTKVDGWTQDEIDALKRAQNTRVFKD